MALSKAFIALGSNESPETSLTRAVEALRQADIGSIVALSRVYESPAHPPASGTFLNAAVCLETKLAAPEVAAKLHDIERGLGRDRTRASVVIDLDLCLFDSLILHENGLDIPRADLMRHAPTIVPVAECDPGFLHPETNEPLRNLARRVQGLDPTALVVRSDIALER